jgi:hypothetical protein
MPSREIHGVELTDGFLDELWVSICEKIPPNQWIPIRKNHEKVVAGIKHFIDMRCYGSSFDISLDKEGNRFKKHEVVRPNTQLTINPFQTSDKDAKNSKVNNG